MHMNRSYNNEQNIISRYDNVLVVNEYGETLYYDVADLSILMKLGHRPEDFLGKNILSFYTNLESSNSTIMNVLRTGQEIINFEQRLLTKTGSSYTSKSSTYPIVESGKVVGAVEFSSHYFDKEDIEHVESYAKHPLYRKNGTQYTIDDIIAKSPHMKELTATFPRIAKSDTNVLLYGKTGTGKNVVAQCLHNVSNRFAKPFITLDCGTLSQAGAEQMLFGVEGGSIGLFEKAEGGTLFLDEVNVLSLEVQARLLKVIEDKKIRRIGGTDEIILDVRIISAINEDPEQLIREHQLREDFYYRLATLRMNLPTLAERKEDIEPFVDYFIHFYNQRMDMNVKAIDESMMRQLENYPWPGNIRELRNAMEAAYHHVEGDELTEKDFSLLNIEDHKQLELISTESLQGNLRDTMENIERALIEEEFQKAKQGLAETARRLGVSKQSLKYKLDKYGLRS
ncbi:AAA family ATPase [Sporosarcina sp. PTS2304]|nr:AAA family ATPase [Sporosarcina sp. PTS2304]